MGIDERYSRQILFDGIGEAGQAALLRARVVIIGCGALGAVQAETLARAGVGTLVLVDRDFVEESNLQRQVMFEESDATDRLPKAVAAAARIGRVNSRIEVEPVVSDVNFENIEEIIAGADLVLDGTDNFETRFLINDACVKNEIPWIYGAAVGSYGLTMTVIPDETPCLRCVLEDLPEPGSSPTCDTSGVIMPVVSIIASLQAAEAMKILTGNREKLHRSLIRLDVWDFQLSRMDLSSFSDRSECVACGKREFEFLLGAGRQVTTTLCGRNAVQIARSRKASLDFPALADKLRPLGQVAFNDFLLRFKVEEYDITVFRDARSIIRGTADPAVARGIYARYIGA
ncbi:MAG TPA: ThiF family adenylyltransferase [Blastocatellia bacterium]|jgi:adenylyltransferase/sulfurtransferase|nr:ThiF family adenylyltransferase [Blastocatellia bacterium]